MNKINIQKDIIYNNKIVKDITIIHISDIHFNSKTKEKKINKIKKEIINNKPDYIVITGDTLDSPKETKNEHINILLKFLKELAENHKILISLGNHDIFNKEDYIFFKELNQINNIYMLDNNSYKDDFIYISGFTLPTNYYYTLEGYEDEEVLIEHLNKYKSLINNLPKDILKVSLIHSPIKLPEEKVINTLHEYDLLLSGHTHNGLVPKFLSKILKKNQGLVAPRNQLFPKIARGKIEINHLNKLITIIISGGITKLGEKSAGILSKLNFIFNIDINKITITNKKGL